METCLRGFSYMPASKLDENLQYIEDGELERAWKVTRRQRLKDQEQRIWEEFVKEQDIVKKAYTEDPYQFLHELPENCLKELMEAELNKMKKETEDEVEGDENIQEQSNQGEGDHPDEKQVVHSVTFAEDNENPDLVMFHIFDDDNELNLSGGEDDPPESPSTVRERCSGDSAPARPSTSDHQCDVTNAEKPPETVSNLIESSIYCARVKDIRMKISEEMVAIMASLDTQDVMSVDRAEVSRRCRRAAEFCGRFNRIYMYQLQRQVHNIKRHVSQCLPLAQHTHFQSQMLRVVSLHQNMLQALQVFHKSFPATSCLRECARALRGACAFVRDASAACSAVPAPRDFPAATHLYNDELLQTCDKLDGALKEYTLRVADYLSSSDVTNLDLNAVTSSTKTKKSKKGLTYTKPGTKTGTKTWSTKDTEARLSMYSLDTLRLNLHPKPSTSRDNNSSGTSKGNASPSMVCVSKPQDKDKPAKRIIRRPLMRAPQSGGVRARAHAPRRDGDIATMVEAVDTCESSHAMSQSISPRSRDRTPRQNTPRQNTPRQYTPQQYTPRQNTPRPRPRPHSPQQHMSRHLSPHSPRYFQRVTPLSKQRTGSPKAQRSRRTSPKNLPTRKSTTTVRSETPTTVTTIKTIAPVTKIQCAKKQPRNKEKSPDRSGKNTDRSRNDKISGRGKENERYDCSARSFTKSCEYSNCKGEKVNKHCNRSKIDKDGNDGSQDTDESNGKVDKDVVYGKVDRLGHIGNPGKEDNTGREFCGVKELTDNDDDYSKHYARQVDEERTEKGKKRTKGSMSPVRCDVTQLLRQLCSGDPAGLTNERVTGAKNAQLLCIRGGSPPRQPSTPQLLRILEETIQKQTPRPIHEKPRNPERYRLNFNIPETTANRIFQYRTKFVQHMLTSPMYANSAVGKPWEVIGSVSDRIIDELLTSIAKEMEINHVLRELYKCETN